MPALTISYSDWSKLTGRVAPFASDGVTLSLLQSVRVFERGGRLMAEATDRYALAFAVAPESVEAPAGFSILLRTPTLVQLGKALGVTPRTHSMVTLTLDPSEDRSSVRITAGGGLPLGDMTMTVPQPEGKYPDLRRLVDKSRSQDVAPSTGYAGWLLARVAKAAGTSPVRFVEHGSNPAYFADDFETIAGLIVPNRGAAPNVTLLDLYAPVAPAEEKAQGSAA